MAEKIAGVILAGGLARRMGGGDKCLIPLGDKTVLDYIIAAFKPQCDALIINANGNVDRFADFGLEVVADTVEGFPGPLAGILAGLEWAAESGITHMATTAGDTPFLPGDLVEKLSGALKKEGADIALARSGDRVHPVVGLWPVAFAPDLRHAITKEQTRKILDWTEKFSVSIVDFDARPSDSFFNINRPEDIEEAMKRIKKI